MDDQPEWRWLALIGMFGIIQTFFDFTPEGPWESKSFSRGVLGLSGICFLYVSWFRFTFKKKNLIPTLEIWQQPESTWLNVLIFGILCYVFVIIINSFDLKQYFPETTGMIVLLIGTLSILNSIYVWLVICGPLRKAELNEQE